MDIGRDELERRFAAAIRELNRDGCTFLKVRDLFHRSDNLTDIEVGRRVQQAVDLCEGAQRRLALPDLLTKGTGTPAAK